MSRSRFEQALAVVGAATILVLGFDSVTFASTGSSLLLGRSNKAGGVTTVANTGRGAALNLVTRSTAYPPFTTNAKGLVANLYAARAVNANKLGGLTVTQILASAKGATGPAGPQGPQGPTGPQGPGAVMLNSQLGTGSPDVTAAVVPDATVTHTCGYLASTPGYSVMHVVASHDATWTLTVTTSSGTTTSGRGSTPAGTDFYLGVVGGSLSNYNRFHVIWRTNGHVSVIDTVLFSGGSAAGTCSLEGQLVPS